jgi:hypothetical protein
MSPGLVHPEMCFIGEGDILDGYRKGLVKFIPLV